jgi:uncharacterized damage-inducible protein DinB
MRLAMLQRMAAYNRWANGRLYAACADLDEGSYFAARPSFFGSIHRTLNHILVADRIWLARVAGEPLAALPLDAELYSGRNELRAAREAEDERLLGLVDGLDEAGLDRRIDYANSKGLQFSHELALVLQHLFNHQTHHRGQVHDMLSGTDVPPPPLDLMIYAREEQARAIVSASNP